VGGTPCIDVVDFFQRGTIGSEVDVDGETLVFGVMLVGIEVAEKPGGSV